ncbi:hypothetical protein J6590_022545 [Homalodisca vitripennis]|nr:hypothetical protein J6590_022545 [Homalodisca vitripennis]
MSYRNDSNNWKSGKSGQHDANPVFSAGFVASSEDTRASKSQTSTESGGSDRQVHVANRNISDTPVSDRSLDHHLDLELPASEKMTVPLVLVGNDNIKFR